MAQPVDKPFSVVAVNTTKIFDLDCDPYQFGDNGRDLGTVVSKTRLKLTIYNGV
jgi:hypothetical protein